MQAPICLFHRYAPAHLAAFNAPCYGSPAFCPARDGPAGTISSIAPSQQKSAVSNYVFKLDRGLQRPAGWIAAGLLALSAATTGCSNIQSQASNVEGVRLFQQGNYQQASDRFQQAIAQDPKSPEGYYNLAASLQNPARSTIARKI